MGTQELDEGLLLENQIAKKKQEEDMLEAQRLLLEAEKTKQEEIDKKLATLEILPMGNRIILEKYPKNPYRKIMQGNFVVDYTGSFINPDSGEQDTMKELVGCAKVIEVGPECKFIQAGDDVYYDTRTVYPLPFMSLGYVVTHEQGILSVLNEGLKKRFEEIKNGKN